MTRSRTALALVALAAVLVGVVALVVVGGDVGGYATVGGNDSRAENGGGADAAGGGARPGNAAGSDGSRWSLDSEPARSAARDGGAASGAATDRATEAGVLRLVVDVIDEHGPVQGARLIVGIHQSDLAWDVEDVSVDAGTEDLTFARTDLRGRAVIRAPLETVALAVQIDHGTHGRHRFGARVDAFPLVVELESLWFLGGRVLEIGERRTDWRVALAIPRERSGRSGAVTVGPFVRDSGEHLQALRTDGRGAFTFAIAGSAPCPLVLWARDADRELAELGPFEPSGAPTELHPELDPLELARVVRLATVALEPPHLETDEQPDTRVWIEADDGTVWWRSGGWTAGPWEANVALPIDWDEPVTVRSDAYRPERLARLGGAARVDLVRGPRVEVTVLDRAQLPDGARWLFGYRTATSSARLFPDDDGRASWHVAGPGPLTIEATLDLPPLADDEARDPRWDALADVRLVIAELEVPAAGLVTTITVPELDDLGALARDATTGGR